MKIELKCGAIYNFHKFRKFRIIPKDDIKLIYLQIQESVGKRWQSVYLFPRMITFTDVPELRHLIEYDAQMEAMKEAIGGGYY